MKKIIFITFILLIFSIISYADFETGNTLYQKLNRKLTGDDKIFGDKVYATGYVVGVFDAYEGLLWTAPVGLIQGQVIGVATKYLEDHPESRHEPATDLLTKAFEEAFPLKKEIDRNLDEPYKNDRR